MLTQRLYKSIIITALAVVTIYYAQSLIMPIIFSALSAMFVHPLVKRFEKMGINLVFSSFIVVLLTTVVIASIGGLFLFEGIDIVKNLPTANAEAVVENPVDVIDDHVAIELNNYTAEINSLTQKIKKSVVNAIPDTLLNVNSVLIFLISCPIYIFFMLISRSSIHKFYYSCFQQSKKKIANRILCQIEMAYINYIKGVGYVLIIVSVLTSVGLYIIGIEHAFFIGFLSGFLTLIPYIGVIVGALIPLAVALLTKDSFWYAGSVVALYAVIQFLEGNIITPKIMGNQLGINPLMIIIGIVIFGAIGGIVAMVLTIPILALIKVVANYIPGWKPLRNLLQV